MNKCFIYLFALFFLYFSHGSALETTPRQVVLETAASEWVARGLFVVTKIEVADCLQDGPLHIDEIAKKVSADPSKLSRILQLLSKNGIFFQVSEYIFANNLQSELLCKSHPNSLHSLICFYGEDIHKSFDGLLPSLNSEKTAFEHVFEKKVFTHFKENPEKGSLFQMAMRDKSKAVIDSILENYSFEKARRVYDIGGGQGQFLKQIIQNYPLISGLNYELKEVIDSFKKQQSQIKHIAGDFLQSIPKGADIYLLKSVIHDFDDEKATQILQNCRLAMNKDAKLLIIEVVLDDSKQSKYANAMDVLMLTVTGGKERNKTSFENLLENAGFKIDRIISTDTEFSIIEVTKKL